jgi:hypothetical protein
VPSCRATLLKSIEQEAKPSSAYNSPVHTSAAHLVLPSCCSSARQPGRTSYTPVSLPRSSRSTRNAAVALPSLGRLTSRLSSSVRPMLSELKSVRTASA